MSQPRTGISRRRILAAGGGLAVAAMVDGAGVAAASVPSSPRFDLTQASHDLFRDKPLARPTVMQSFTFDNVNRRLFVAQLADDADAGNLCVTQLDFSGNQVGQMSLTGFGHGVSIGVEAAGSDSYLWTEVDAVDGWGPDSPASGSSTGRPSTTRRARCRNTSPSPVSTGSPVPSTRSTSG
jgi:hypothetical protein